MFGNIFLSIYFFFELVMFSALRENSKHHFFAQLSAAFHSIVTLSYIPGIYQVPATIILLYMNVTVQTGLKQNETILGQLPSVSAY